MKKVTKYSAYTVAGATLTGATFVLGGALLAVPLGVVFVGYGAYNVMKDLNDETKDSAN